MRCCCRMHVAVKVLVQCHSVPGTVPWLVGSMPSWCHSSPKKWEIRMLRVSQLCSAPGLGLVPAPSQHFHRAQAGRSHLAALGLSPSPPQSPHPSEPLSSKIITSSIIIHHKPQLPILIRGAGVALRSAGFKDHKRG